ncbi:hypothetical protein F4782DRAFT_140215 [Xylaria castorea]|nr:hypothetical protein F4782DRAFT_140215 [Xylaria castorea]
MSAHPIDLFVTCISPLNLFAFSSFTRAFRLPLSPPAEGFHCLILFYFILFCDVSGVKMLRPTALVRDSIPLLSAMCCSNVVFFPFFFFFLSLFLSIMLLW